MKFKGRCTTYKSFAWLLVVIFYKKIVYQTLKNKEHHTSENT